MQLATAKWQLATCNQVAIFASPLLLLCDFTANLWHLRVARFMARGRSRSTTHAEVCYVVFILVSIVVYYVVFILVSIVVYFVVFILVSMVVALLVLLLSAQAGLGAQGRFVPLDEDAAFSA